MAEKLEIEVEISPEGEVRLETHGLKGEVCLEETKGLEARLGRVTARSRTSEFWQRVTGAVGALTRR